MKNIEIVFYLIIFFNLVDSVNSANFYAIGDIPGGEIHSVVNNISGDGNIIIGESQATFGDRGYYWTSQEGIQSIPDLLGGPTSNSSNAVSFDGTVVVGWGLSESAQSGVSGEEGFSWTSSGGSQGLGFFITQSGSTSRAKAVSGDGLVIAGSSTLGAGTTACIWVNGLITSIGDLPGGSVSSDARGISMDGSVIVGGSYSGDGFQGFRWESGIMVPLKTNLPSGSVFGSAQSVSADGTTIVGWIAGAEPIKWVDPDTFIQLGDLPGGDNNGVAYDVSGDGSIIVGWSSSWHGNEAFIWDQTNGMRNLRDVLIDEYNLDLAGWWLNEAMAISDNGRVIAGNGINPNGIQEGWVVYLDENNINCNYSLVGDLNNDCINDLSDFALYATTWLIDCNLTPFNSLCIPN